MPDVLIVTDPISIAPEVEVLSLADEMQQAILAESLSDSGETTIGDAKPRRVGIVSTLDFEKHPEQYRDRILCALTLNLPEAISFPAKEIFLVCSDVEALRQMVAGWHYEIGEGTHWLPIVLTAKGALFAEAITTIPEAKSFQQPLHLNDAQRQPLYQLGQRLTKTLAASPSVMLLQFGMDDDQMRFDRLIPFPDTPAIASVGVQTPNLFRCHWRCLTHQPIRELTIMA